MAQGLMSKPASGDWSLERIARGLTHRVKGVAAKRPGTSRFCVVCGQSSADFGPYRGGWAFAPALVREVGYVAGDYDDCYCTKCSSTDRERHLQLYLSALSILDDLNGKRVIHFAPELHTRSLIKAANPQEYIMCDIAPKSADIRQMDLLNLDFPDDSVDLVIVNHVLEHVPDFEKALSEIRRVLKPEGMAIMQTPFCLGLQTTWEDDGIVTEAARYQAFGQEDHVRLFGMDLFERILQAGFSSRGGSHADLLPDVDAWRNGVDPREPFFLYSKSS
jgi:hypothetical protein